MTAYQSNETITEAFSKSDLVGQLNQLGIKEGMVLEVHSSLKSLGYVIGGAQTVVDALIDAVGFEGTLVMPIQASSNCEPYFWENPPAERKLIKKIRDSIPAFDPDSSDIMYMGEIAANLNRRDGAYRSYHPNSAFVSYGKYGKLITNQHSLSWSLGEQSPLKVMYDLPSSVLLMGAAS